MCHNMLTHRNRILGGYLQIIIQILGQWSGCTSKTIKFQSQPLLQVIIQTPCHIQPLLRILDDLLWADVKNGTPKSVVIIKNGLS